MSSSQAEVLSVIGRIWSKYPDLRFCQLLGNVFTHDPYYVADSDLIKRLEEVYSHKDSE